MFFFDQYTAVSSSTNPRIVEFEDELPDPAPDLLIKTMSISFVKDGSTTIEIDPKILQKFNTVSPLIKKTDSIAKEIADQLLWIAIGVGAAVLIPAIILIAIDKWDLDLFFERL